MKAKKTKQAFPTGNRESLPTGKAAQAMQAMQAALAGQTEPTEPTLTTESTLSAGLAPSALPAPSTLPTPPYTDLQTDDRWRCRRCRQFKSRSEFSGYDEHSRTVVCDVCASTAVRDLQTYNRATARYSRLRQLIPPGDVALAQQVRKDPLAYSYCKSCLRILPVIEMMVVGASTRASRCLPCHAAYVAKEKLRRRQAAQKSKALHKDIDRVCIVCMQVRSSTEFSSRSTACNDCRKKYGLWKLASIQAFLAQRTRRQEELEKQRLANRARQETLDSHKG